MKRKMLYINGYDRSGIFRFGIANGERIPSGIIAGKGWTLRVNYKEVIRCDKCNGYVFEDGLCENCKSIA